MRRMAARPAEPRAVPVVLGHTVARALALALRRLHVRVGLQTRAGAIVPGSEKEMRGEADGVEGGNGGGGNSCGSAGETFNLLLPYRPSNQTRSSSSA